MYLRYNFISIKDWPIENHNYEGFSLEMFWVYPIRYYSLLVSRFLRSFCANCLQCSTLSEQVLHPVLYH